jgi:methylenetetrahydrofolate dehydrogenase (NADP+)/methenyltetrahydrofolate cyclohydrolase
MTILDGKKLKQEILDEVKSKIEKNNAKMKLAIIQVGNNEASNIYVGQKLKACEYVGIEGNLYKLDENVSQEELLTLIDKLNKDDEVYGIILQSPIRHDLDFDYCSNKILASKDIDGFTRDSVYGNYINDTDILPCTVKGIITLLDKYEINLDGTNVVIVGRGNIVGKPLMLAMLNKNATVTVAHSHTKNLVDVCKTADVLISAVGKKGLITADHVKDGAVVIDVGITRVDGKIYGDVDFDNVKDKVSYITPVPGGVGPLTVASIILQLYEMYERRNING